MTDQETITKQQKEIARLKRRIEKLKTRLLEKKFFETVELEQRGATPQFIARIDAKDQEALKE